MNRDQYFTKQAWLNRKRPASEPRTTGDDGEERLVRIDSQPPTAGLGVPLKPARDLLDDPGSVIKR